MLSIRACFVIVMEMEFTKNGQETVYYKIFDFFLLVFEVSTETILNLLVL